MLKCQKVKGLMCHLNAKSLIVNLKSQTTKQSNSKHPTTKPPYLCNVKKFFLTILTFLYLLLSTGFTLEVHYCMGAIASIDISSNDESICAKCGMKEKNTGCCRDEIKFYKFDKGFKSSKNIAYHQTLVSAPVTTFNVQDYSRSLKSLEAKVTSSIEPVIGGPPIYLRNRVFRI